MKKLNLKKIGILLNLFLILSVIAGTAFPEIILKSDVHARAQGIESGAYYRIVSRHSGKALDVSGRSINNGGNVHQWNKHNGTSQHWKIVELENGYYKLVAKHSGKVLDVSGRSRDNGASVHQWDWHGGNNQQWRIEHIPGGYYRIVSRHSGRVLDISRRSTSNGANIHQWHWHGANSQQWILEKVEEPKLIPSIDSNEYYRLVAKHSGKVLDVSGRSTRNGGNVHQWDWHGGNNQQWKIEHVEGGYYRLISRHSGLVLDVSQRSLSNGSSLHQWAWRGLNNQLWEIVDVGGGYYKLVAKHSGKVLDVSGRSTRNGSNIHQWDWRNGNNQKWKIEKVSSIEKPNTPTKVSAETDRAEVHITWDAVNNATGYDIEINGTVVKQGLESNEYIYEGAFDTQYSIRVRSVRQGASSSWSDEVIVRTSLEPLYINSDFVLTENMHVGDVILNAGTLILNGQKLTVNGNVFQASDSSVSTISIGGGQLYVEGDYIIETLSGHPSQGSLNMQNHLGYVQVKGNFIANNASSINLNAGILEVKGNFLQKSVYGTFRTGGTHKVILSGEGYQKVSFRNSFLSNFNILEITNTSSAGVEFLTRTMIVKELKSTDSVVKNSSNIFLDGNAIISGGHWKYDLGAYWTWRLSKDEVIEGNLVITGGRIDLNGHKLMVKANVLHQSPTESSSGIMDINGGKLHIKGDYVIGAPLGEVGYGVLRMKNELDYVKVEGDFVINTNNRNLSSDNLDAGVLEIKGDFIQKTPFSFKTRGTHKVILSGTDAQKVSFDDYVFSNFSVLEITNTSEEGVEFLAPVGVINELKSTDSIVKNSSNIFLAGDAIISGGSWKYDLGAYCHWWLSQDEVIEGNLIITSGTVILNKNKLTVRGDVLQQQPLGVWVPASVMDIRGGKLYVTGDYILETSSGEVSAAILRMKSEDDYVKVGGDFIIHSVFLHEGYLSAGTLEVKGNFIQKNTEPYLNEDYNFRPTGTHKVVLSGTEVQHVSFSDDLNKFNILVLSKPLEEGYVFNTEQPWNELRYQVN